jgi:hypothetical protein
MYKMQDIDCYSLTWSCGLKGSIGWCVMKEDDWTQVKWQASLIIHQT